jgi:phage baseplate assembly protein W
MIEYNSVVIENINFAAQGNEEIFQNLMVLYTTIEGTVPFDREFGINIDFIDEPAPIAQGKLIVEYTQKTRRFEPRASVSEVKFGVNPQTGNFIPKVVINLVAGT